jgi:hypothetical protein
MARRLTPAGLFILEQGSMSARLPVPGFEHYLVSSEGRAWSVCAGIELKLNRDKDGYLLLHTSDRGRRKAFKMHRLVLELFGCPAPSPKHVVNHKDGNKANNIIDNLEWVTRAENNRHASATGLIPRGELAQAALLTWEQVGRIREQYATGGYTYYDLADEYGVTYQNIHCIVRNKSWRGA